MNLSAIISLSRVLSKNSEMKMPDRKLYKALALIAVLGIMIPCTFIVGFISYVMTEALIEVGNPGGGVLFETQILSAFSMTFGIMVIFSIMFFSSDREHFTTLPIKSETLMMAKFFFAYFAESIMEFLILIAVFVGYAIAMGRNLGLWAAINPISLISMAAGVVLIPLVPMIYCAIFSLILMTGLAKFKSTKMFYRTSTIFLLLFALLFVYSLRGIGDVNMENYVVSLGSGDNSFLRVLNIIFFTVPWLSDAISSGSILKLFMYLLANVTLLFILYFLGKLLYQRGLYTAASLGSSTKAELKKDDIKEESQFVSSLKKELKVILRTKAFSGNCAYINVLWPAGALALLHFTKGKEAMAAFIDQFSTGNDRAEMILFMIIIGISFIATALNSLASTAFTREGQHLELIKFIPVPYKTQMLAKAAVCCIFTAPMLLITDIIICIYMHASVYICVFYALIMLMGHVIALIVGMSMDSAAPYREWDDEYSALRGNLNVFFSMAVMMVICIIAIAIGLIMHELLKLPIFAYYVAAFLILLGVMIRMIFVGPKIIVKNMEEMF